MRNSANTLASLIILLLLAVACNKAPDGIIKESKMVDLLADLYKAEAYTDVYRADFSNDSLLMELKQSVFAKHGVSQDDYDKSLEWYAHNMDTYSDVCRRATEKLDAEKKKAYHDGNKAAKETKPDINRDEQADDIWHGTRTWTLTPGMKNGFVTFEIDACKDIDTRLGDRYVLTFKATSISPKSLGVMFAADYSDGATNYLSRQTLANGWNRVTLQTDSTRTVRRIYGYFNYRLDNQHIAYLDSVQILRSKLNKTTYSHAGVQKLVERNTIKAIQEKKENEMGPKDMRKDAFDNKPHFVPKEGLNKSSVPKHIKSSPNAEHLPNMSR